VKLWGVGAYEREPVDGSETRYKTLSRVEADDIIVNKIWARNGSVAVIPNDLAGCYVSGEFPTFEPVRDRLEPQWFKWITKTRFFWDQCDAKSRGTSGKNRIRPERFLEIEIPLPPLSEQRRIVARIEELAAKINEAHGLSQLAAEEAEALALTAARTMLSSLHCEPSQLSRWLDPNREGIQTGPFGAQLSRSEFGDNGRPLLTIGNVQYGGLDTTNLKFVSEGKARELSRYELAAGDVLFARMGTVGRCCVVPPIANGWLINYHIIRVALDQSKVDSRFVHWTIRASTEVEEYLNDKIRGATREGVNSTIVAQLPCRVPSLTEQRRIVAELEAIQTQLDALQKLQAMTAAELDALLPSILDRAFKGGL
jgi:type I restriction enzyme S subunit